MRKLVPIALLLLSCDAALSSDGGSPPGAERNGSRLQRLYLSADDGTRVPSLLLFDTRLGQPCTFESTGADPLQTAFLCVPPGTPMPVANPSQYVSARISR